MKLTSFLAAFAIGLACMMSYQQGWINRDNRAKAENARITEANRTASAEAGKSLQFQIEGARGVKLDAQAALREAMSYETADDPDTCGIPIDGVRLLQKIR